MGVKVHVSKWGNSLGLRIPAKLAREYSITDGSELEVVEEDGAIILRPSKSPKPFSLHELAAKITPQNRHDETDWESPVGREEW